MHSHVLGLNTMHDCLEIKCRNFMAIVRPVGCVIIAMAHSSTTFFLSSIHGEQIGSASAKSCTYEMDLQANVSTQADEFASNPIIP